MQHKAEYFIQLRPTQRLKKHNMTVYVFETFKGNQKKTIILNIYFVTSTNEMEAANSIVEKYISRGSKMFAFITLRNVFKSNIFWASKIILYDSHYCKVQGNVLLHMSTLFDMQFGIFNSFTHFTSALTYQGFE